MSAARVLPDGQWLVFLVPSTLYATAHRVSMREVVVALLYEGDARV